MDIDDPHSSAFRALKYLCELGWGDPHLCFTVVSLSRDLGLSEQEGRSVFGFLVGKGLARYRGSDRVSDTVVPSDAGFERMEYFLNRPKKTGASSGEVDTHTIVIPAQRALLQLVK
jgi:hypothetical protein